MRCEFGGELVVKMMKAVVKIRIQKIIMFIPIINVLPLFFWVITFMKTDLKTSVFMKSLGIIFTGMLIVVIPVMVLNYGIGKDSWFIENLVTPIHMYLTPLVMDFGLLRFQHKLGIK